MKRLISCIFAFVAFAAQATTLSPIQLLNPTGSTAGQAIVSTGASSAPAWTTVPKTTSPLSQFSATTSAQLAGVLSDETGTGAAVFGTSPTITTPNIVGVTSGSNAAAGSVGEVPTPTNLTNVSLTNNVPVNAASVLLAAGDYDVSCAFGVTPAASTVIGNVIGGINTVSATQQSSSSGAVTAYQNYATSIASGGNAVWQPTPIVRENLTSSTTVYCVVSSLFSTSTATASGVLHVRRLR